MIEVFFILWVIISVWAQFKNKYSLKFRFFGFVPNNRLFSPKPVSHDYAILYQDVNMQKWYKVEFPNKNNLTLFWCPAIRLTKSQGTIVRQLIKLRDNDFVILTSPYLRILNIVNEKAKKRNFSRVKFMICLYQGFESSEHKYVFISNEHNIS